MTDRGPHEPSTVSRNLELPGDGGLILAADAWGDPAGLPVLLWHGGGQTRHAWGGTAQALGAAGFYAVSVDLRGHGDSAWSDDGVYNIDSFKADVASVCAQFDRPPALVGASLGGMASLLALGEDPAIASALVLVDIVPHYNRAGADRVVSFMTQKPEGFASLEEVADAVAAYLPHRPRPKDLSGLEKNLRLGEDGRYRWHWDPRFLTHGAGPGKLMSGNRLIEAADGLALPCLLVRGRMSDVVDEAGAKAFLELVPHARFVDVSDAGHMVAGDRNDAFTGAVVDFLTQEPVAVDRDLAS